MVVFKGGKEFQQKCVARLLEVFVENGLDEVRFERRSNGLNWFAAEFTLKGRQHTVGVYERDVTMTAGDSLFECYMRHEFASEEALIESFAARLDRYLSGGPWEGLDEKSFPELIKEKVKSLLRWKTAR
jgi:hypothetical protein